MLSDVDDEIQRDPLRDILHSPIGEPDGRRRWLMVAVAVGVLLIVGLFVALNRGPDLGSAGESTTTLASTSSSTRAEPVLLLDDPPVVLGDIGPDPLFEAGALGAQDSLDPVEGLTVSQRSWFGDSSEATSYLAVESRLVAGELRGSSAVMLVMTGTVVDPYDLAFGAAGVCYSLVRADSGTGECYAHDPQDVPIPLFTGLVGSDVVAWGLVPEATAVAVLSVNGVDAAWERPRGSSVVFSYMPQVGDVLVLRMLDSQGAEIGRADRSGPGPLTGVYVERITGYGDFSGRPDEVDQTEVNALIVACVNAQGPVKLFV